MILRIHDIIPDEEGKWSVVMIYSNILKNHYEENLTPFATLN